jgi:hypothetical protein
MTDSNDKTLFEASLGLEDDEQTYLTARLIREAIGLKPEDKRFDSYFTSRDCANGPDGSAIFSIHHGSEGMLTTLYNTAREHAEQGILTQDYIDCIKAVTDTRGTCVRIRLEDEGDYKVVTRGFPHTPTITVDTDFNLEASKLSLTDFHGVQRNYLTKNLTFYPRTEGCVIRVTSDGKGGSIANTNGRLDISQSRWGNSDTFFDSWKKFGGPSTSKLFPEGCDMDTTYLFMIVDPDLQVASMYPIGDGYIMYLGSVSNSGNSNPGQPPCFDEFVSTGDGYVTGSDGKTSISLESIMPCTDKDGDGKNGVYKIGTIFTPAPLDPIVAQLVLEQGYSSVKRENFGSDCMTGGDTLVMYNDDGSIVFLSPIAANWRRALVNNAHNMTFRFYTYSSYAMNRMKKPIIPTNSDESGLTNIFNGREGNIYTIDQLFPKIASPPVEWFSNLSKQVTAAFENQNGRINDVYADVVKLVQEETVKCTKTNPYKGDKPMDRFSNVAICYFLGISTSYIKDTVGYYPDYVENRAMVHRKISANLYQFKQMCDNGTLWQYNEGFANWEGGNGKVADTLTRIMKQAYKRAFEDKENGRDKSYTRNGKTITPSFEQQFKYNIRSLLFNESGKTFYNLSRVFKTIASKPAHVPGGYKGKNFKPRYKTKSYSHQIDNFPGLNTMGAPPPPPTDSGAPIMDFLSTVVRQKEESNSDASLDLLGKMTMGGM